jgi:hypothetical protein
MELVSSKTERYQKQCETRNFLFENRKTPETMYVRVELVSSETGESMGLDSIPQNTVGKAWDWTVFHRTEKAGRAWDWTAVFHRTEKVGKAWA